MTETAAKCRLPRTGTLVLIAVVLLAGGGVFSVWWPYHRERIAISEIESFAGKVDVTSECPDWLLDTISDEYLEIFEHAWQVDLQNKQVTYTCLMKLNALPNLRSLVLTGTELSDKRAIHVSKTNKLTLRQGTRFGDEDLGFLEGLVNLEYLWLDHSEITDEGVLHFRGLTNLQGLSLEHTHVGDAAVEDLKGLTNLHFLWLSGTNFTHDGIKRLQFALPDCRIIWTPQWQ